MDSYRVEWKRAATKEIGKLPRDTRLKILGAVERLHSNPLPAGVRKLVGSEHTYRLREGDYRIIYTITASVLLIEIIRVGHRKDVYDRLG
ncbi:MAG TPA: type II toxin-antitoxin system RelE/ParE family toxin [Pyrinomonadaceae bacterium]|nr:type II toxin-antitoxin system RelE/ParE family toxin [Pyrinomonadaceae bacterium]